MLIGVIAGIIAAAIALGIAAVVIVMLMRHRDLRAQGSDINQVGPIRKADGDGESSHRSGGRAVRAGKASSAAKPADSLGARFAALGTAAAAVFAILGAKLWSMQIMSSDSYSKEAEKNLYTTVDTPAPRGSIYDRNGEVLITNRISQTVLAEPEVAEDANVMRRLSAVLGVPLGVVRERLRDTSSGAQSQRVVASNVSLRDVAFISEHSDAFKGVSVESRTVRQYPYRGLAAHVLGYTGSPTEDELEYVEAGRDVKSTDIVGKSGIESYYDSLLSGDKGERKVMVDAAGNVLAITAETAPGKGSDVYLTIDAGVQYVADKALAEAIAPEGDIGTGSGVAGAVVAMDVTNGDVIAMASYPTFDPSTFTDGIPQDVWDLYNTEQSHAPMLNRAVNGEYAAASTFKAFSSLAALNYGFADKNSAWNCSGHWTGFGEDDAKNCWLLSGHGTLGLHSGIVVSCDVPFYEIGKAFYDHGPEGTGELSETALQDFYRQYNFGSGTGIDIKDESIGRVPTPDWKAEQWRNVPSEANWRGGDYTNMVIGQGDILVTPLQVATGYTGVINGKVVKPHLLKEVRNASGDVVVTANTEIISEPEVDKKHIKFVKDGLRNVVTDNAIVYNAFIEAGAENSAGKSGTAEHGNTEDDGWFVAYAPYDKPKYVVACIIEQGGSGSDKSASVVAQVMGAALKSGTDDAVKPESIAGSSGVSVVKEFTGTVGRQD